MYFKYFRKIRYGFDKKHYKLVTDLMTRIKVRDKVINEISLYDARL